jgi:hypothetical protein
MSHVGTSAIFAQVRNDIGMAQPAATLATLRDATARMENTMLPPTGLIVNLTLVHQVLLPDSTGWAIQKQCTQLCRGVVVASRRITDNKYMREF